MKIEDDEEEERREIICPPPLSSLKRGVPMGRVGGCPFHFGIGEGAFEGASKGLKPKPQRISEWLVVLVRVRGCPE